MKTALALSAPQMAEEEWAALFRNNLLRSCWKPGLTSDEVQHVLTLWERKLVEVRPPRPLSRPASRALTLAHAHAALRLRMRVSCVDPTHPSSTAEPLLHPPHYLPHYLPRRATGDAPVEAP